MMINLRKSFDDTVAAVKYNANLEDCTISGLRRAPRHYAVHSETTAAATGKTHRLGMRTCKLYRVNVYILK